MKHNVYLPMNIGGVGITSGRRVEYIWANLCDRLRFICERLGFGRWSLDRTYFANDLITKAGCPA